KRALTDPRILDGIGNAYSDEILHRAHLSPVKLTGQLSEAEAARLLEACRATLADWVDRLRREAGDRFPEGVTAFRNGMAVLGRRARCRSPSVTFCRRCARHPGFGQPRDHRPPTPRAP